MREASKEKFYAQMKTFSMKRLVVMLDTCEWLTEPEGIEVGQWVLNELVPGLQTRIRQQGRQFHVVIASRVKLKLDAINGRDQQRLTLSMLGKAEVDQWSTWGCKMLTSASASTRSPMVMRSVFQS
jgi:hypothetical protein